MMADREKVIRALECCINNEDCPNCPYDGTCRNMNHTLDRDALELLQNGGTKKPTPVWTIGDTPLYRCAGCGSLLLVKRQAYCHDCGLGVMWDG